MMARDIEVGLMILAVLAFLAAIFFVSHLSETEQIHGYRCNVDTSFYHERYLRGPDEGEEFCELKSQGNGIFQNDNCAFKKAWCDNQREISGINAAVKSMEKVQQDLDRASNALKQRKLDKAKQELEAAARNANESRRFVFPLMLDFMTRKVIEAVRWVLFLK